LDNKFWKGRFKIAYRWKPQEIPTDKKVTFIEGIQTMSGAGGPAMKV